MASEETEKPEKDESATPPKAPRPGTDWLQRMQDFRMELKAYRNSHLEQQQSYAKITLDTDYLKMRESGDLSVPEDEITRFYPEASSLFEKRKPVDLRRKSFIKAPPKLRQDVHIREFREDRKVIKAQIARMKRQNKPMTSPQEVLRNIQQEIPLPRTRQDLETVIGENLSWVAGIIIFLGISVLFRYGINQGFINEEWRVITGLSLGGMLLAGAHMVLKSTSRFARLLVILAMVSIYYTLGLSVHDYQMFSPAVAFLVGVLVTIATSTIGLLYQREDLVHFAYAGGVVMPVVIGGRGSNFSIYFIWLFLLGSAHLFIAIKKGYHRAYGLVFWFSTVALLVWVIRQDFGLLEYQGLLAFGLVFYLALFGTLVLFHARMPHFTPGYDYALLLLLHFIYLPLLIYALNGSGLGNYRPLLTGGMAILNGWYAFVFFGSKVFNYKIYRTLLTFAILLSASSVFMQFRMLYVNSFWAMQAVLLAWLGMAMKEKLVRDYAALLLAAGFLSMIYNWTQTYWSPGVLPFMFNSGFWASLVTTASLVLFVLLYHAEKEDYPVLLFSRDYLAKLMSGLALVVGYITFFFEIIWHTPDLVGGRDTRVVLLDAYTMLYVFLLRATVNSMDIRRLKSTVGPLVSVTVVFYLLFGHPATLDLRQGFINKNLPLWPFLLHYVNVVLSVYLVINQIKDVSEERGEDSGQFSVVLWLLSAVIVFHLSYEFEHVIVLIAQAVGGSYDFVIEQVRLTGFSVLWALASLAFMFAGMRLKYKVLRIISLVLFGITLLKFLFFDFWKLQPFGQIVALISLGAVLLVASRMYQRLQKLVEMGQLTFDKDTKATEDEIASMSRAGLFSEDDDEDDDREQDSKSR